MEGYFLKRQSSIEYCLFYCLKLCRLDIASCLGKRYIKGFKRDNSSIDNISVVIFYRAIYIVGIKTDGNSISICFLNIIYRISYCTNLGKVFIG